VLVKKSKCKNDKVNEVSQDNSILKVTNQNTCLVFIGMVICPTALRRPDILDNDKTDNKKKEIKMSTEH